MKTLKSILVLCLTILSQVVFADNWNYLQASQNGYTMKLNYTREYLPATIGSPGGYVTGKAFIDVFSPSASVAERVEIFEVQKNGSRLKRQDIRLNEDHAKHFWGQLKSGPSYADHLYVGSTYVMKLTIDGRFVEFRMTLN